MSTSSANVTRPSRRWWRPQFSLRVLLIVVTVVPIALWYWQRPFEREVVITQPRPQPFPATPELWSGWKLNPIDPYSIETLGRFVWMPTSAGYYCREVRTLRRFGFGEPLADGPTRQFDISGQLRGEEHWRRGLRHGGTLPTHTPLFVVLLISVVIIVGALTFIPALALRPIVEQLQMLGG